MIDLVTTKVVCDITGCDGHHARRCIDAMQKEGKIDVVRAGLSRLILRKDVDKVKDWLIKRKWIKA